MKKETKFSFENSIIILFSLIFAFFFLIESPLHPWNCGSTATDSSVFKTIALMMEKGYMPYKDSFDHKGPVLYVLNYLGNMISYYRGIWIIELLSLTITIFFMYKIARLICGIASSLIAMLTAFSLLFIYFYGGNFTEEYAMPCIAYSVYAFLDYLLNANLSYARVKMVGFCLGYVLLLRPNMIAVWIVFCLYVLVKLLRQKEYEELIHILLAFICGILIVFVPILIWLMIKGDLQCFWFDYITFNRLYTSSDGGNALFSRKWSAFINFSNTTIYIISIWGVIYSLKDKKNKSTNLVYLVYIIVTIILMVLSGEKYEHYGMIIVPALAYPIGLLFNSAESIEIDSIKKVIIMLMGIYCLSTFIMPNWLELIDFIPELYENRLEKDYGIDVNCVVNFVEKNTTDSDKISVYGNWDIIYVLSKREHATKYSYQFPISQVMPAIKEDYFTQLQDELPKIIVITLENSDEDIISFVNKNNYKLACKVYNGYTYSAVIYLR